MASAEDWFNGTIWVTIYAGKDLPAGDRNGLSDPYVTISSAPEAPEGGAVKTTVKKKTLDPEWCEQFEFTVRHATEVVLNVLDKDRFGSDDLGTVRIPIAHLVHTNKIETWYPLDTSGQLHAAVWFRPDVDMEQALFGVDVMTLQARSRPETEMPIPEVIKLLAVRAEELGIDNGAYGAADATMVDDLRRRLDRGDDPATVAASISDAAIAYDLLMLLFKSMPTATLPVSQFPDALTVGELGTDVFNVMMEMVPNAQKHLLQFIGGWLNGLAMTTMVTQGDFATAWGAGTLMWPDAWVRGAPFDDETTTKAAAFVETLMDANSPF